MMVESYVSSLGGTQDSARWLCDGEFADNFSAAEIILKMGKQSNFPVQTRRLESTSLWAEKVNFLTMMGQSSSFPCTSRHGSKTLLFCQRVTETPLVISRLLFSWFLRLF